jgi:HEAT repeat protein
MNATEARLIAALAATDASTRLKAALATGSNPELGMVDILIARCAIEPDFYVRDMLTWALTRYPPEITVPRLTAQLRSDEVQAQSQALHTLSKVGDRSAFPAITASLLHNADDEVARSAWRAAVILVPDDDRGELAELLAAQFGRGDRELQLSLSRALLALGPDAVEPVLRSALARDAPEVRAHVAATARLLEDPNAAFELSAHEARRQYALKDRPA